MRKIFVKGRPKADPPTAKLAAKEPPQPDGYTTTTNIALDLDTGSSSAPASLHALISSLVVSALDSLVLNGTGDGSALAGTGGALRRGTPFFVFSARTLQVDRDIGYRGWRVYLTLGDGSQLACLVREEDVRGGGVNEIVGLAADRLVAEARTFFTDRLHAILSAELSTEMSRLFSRRY